jgi:hypothetical protein
LIFNTFAPAFEVVVVLATEPVEENAEVVADEVEFTTPPGSAVAVEDDCKQ